MTLWEIDGETVETVSDFILGGSKITADGDCSHEIKRCLLLGRKVMSNLDSIFKNRDITLPTKVRLVKAMVFPVVMYGCESWTVKKAECWRIDALNCGVGEDSWESLGLQGDPTSPFWRRSALGFLWREWCWSWNSSTLATSCEELTHWKRLWCWEGLGAGGEGMTEDEMAGWHHWLDGREFEVTPGVGDGQEGLACCNSWGRKESDMTERLHWTELNVVHILALMDSTDKGIIILFINTYFSANCDRTSGGKDIFSKTELSWKSTNSGHCFVLNYLVKWKYQ